MCRNSHNRNDKFVNKTTTENQTKDINTSVDENNAEIDNIEKNDINLENIKDSDNKKNEDSNNNQIQGEDNKKENDDKNLKSTEEKKIETPNENDKEDLSLTQFEKELYKEESEPMDDVEDSSEVSEPLSALGSENSSSLNQPSNVVESIDETPVDPYGVPDLDESKLFKDIEELRNESKRNNGEVREALVQSELNKLWEEVMEFLEKELHKEEVIERVVIKEVTKHQKLIDEIIEEHNKDDKIYDQDLLGSFGLTKEMLSKYGITEECINEKIKKDLDNEIDDESSENPSEEVKIEVKDEKQILDNSSIFEILESHYKIGSAS